MRYKALIVQMFLACLSLAQIPQHALRPAVESVNEGTIGNEAYSIHVGAFIAPKAGVNTVVAHGRKTDVNLNLIPDFGASVIIPFSSGGKIGAGLDIGYATYSYRNKPERRADDANTIVERYSYVNLFPHLTLYGFIVGLNVGLSPKGSARTVSGTTVSVTTDGETSINSKYLTTLLELRLGANVPIFATQSGHLNLYLIGGYLLNGMYNDYRDYLYSRDDYISPSAENNPRPASLALGLAYYFRVPLE